MRKAYIISCSAFRKEGDSCLQEAALHHLGEMDVRKTSVLFPLEDQLLPSLQLNVHKPHPRTQVPLFSSLFARLRVTAFCSLPVILILIWCLFEVHRRRGHCQLYAHCSPVVLFFLFFVLSSVCRSMRRARD